MIVDYWYDKSVKSWIISRKDNSGNQIGNVDYTYSKREALDLVKYYKNINNLVIL